MVNPVIGSTLAANAFTELTITSDEAIDWMDERVADFS